MYKGFLDLHSFLRYVVLALLLIAIFKSFIGWRKKKEFTAADNKISLFTMIATHLQLLIGLILYFVSPLVQAALSDMKLSMKDAILRFWAVEHLSMMIVAIVFITMGRIMAKKAATSTAKHKRTALLFGLGLLIILFAIPWPFSKVPRPWF